MKGYGGAIDCNCLFIQYWIFCLSPSSGIDNLDMAPIQQLYSLSLYPLTYSKYIEPRFILNSHGLGKFLTCSSGKEYILIWALERCVNVTMVFFMIIILLFTIH